MNLFLLSGLTYGFLEYTIHRFLHVIKETKHRKHHEELKNDDDFSASFQKSINMFNIVIFFKVLSYFVLEEIGTFVFYLWIQYVLYEFTHDIIHRYKIPGIAKYHSIHHYCYKYRLNYGVTTPFWDYVFGTMSDYNMRRVNFLIYVSWLPWFNFLNFMCFIKLV